MEGRSGGPVGAVPAGPPAGIVEGFRTGPCYRPRTMAAAPKTMKPGSKLRASDAVLFRELDGEAVLLNLGTNTYFGLNEAGTRMWNLLVEHGELEPVRERLRTEYDVDDEQLGADLESLVEDLLDHHLLVLDDVD